MPVEQWSRLEKLLPGRPRTTPKGGRPRIQCIKPIADAIFLKMRTGCQWQAIPRTFGASSTIHDSFQEWIALSVFELMWDLALQEYDYLRGISWKHQSLDTTTVTASLGGKKTGKNPTDRGKLRCERSILVDGLGMPLPCELVGANFHNGKIVPRTLKKREYKRTRTRSRKRLHVHCDKGYDSSAVRTVAKRNGYIPHMPRGYGVDGRLQ